LPEGVQRVDVDYNDHSGLVEALKGQDFLIITLFILAPPETEGKILKAAAEAGVKYVMPNIYGADIKNEKMKEDMMYQMALKTVGYIESLGMKHFTLACAVWYEWSVAAGEGWFGFTIQDRTVTMFDDGKIKVPVSTWPDCGKAIAAFLSLPISSLEKRANQPLYVQSFELSQFDMLHSIHKVLGTSDSDWKITYQSTAERAQQGLEAFQKGGFESGGMGRYLYMRYFQRAAAGELKQPRDDLDALGVKKDTIDDATRKAVEMVQEGWTVRRGHEDDHASYRN
jgi:hypothetical protein